MKLFFWLGRLVTRFFGSLLWSVNLLLFLYTLLVYYLGYYLKTEHWVAGILMMTLPVAWAFNLIFLVFWVGVWKPYRSLLPLITMLLGIPFWPRTFSFHQPADPMPGETRLRVLSYNVSGFNRYSDNMTKHPDSAKPLIEWVVSDSSDVKCFQEYANDSKSVLFSTTRKLERAGYRYYAMLEQMWVPYGETFIGVSIFSRYPILKRGCYNFDPDRIGLNGIVWADIRVKTDTIRIFSVHLESMGIRVGRLVEAEEASVVKREARGVVRSLREGFTLRRDQIRILEDYIQKSPYPVIVCGDFNETPYSVTYGRLRRRLNNAFESAGWGVDFSYNKAPGFIRIDNQFYDPTYFRALSFVTYKEVDYSDHYPIVGEYALKKQSSSATK